MPFRRVTFFLDELAKNASDENIGIFWYSGNNDALSTHWSTEITIQVRSSSAVILSQKLILFQEHYLRRSARFHFST